MGKYFGEEVSQASFKVFNLTTRKSGLDFLMEYNDMIRSLRRNGLEWTLEHNELARKFSKRKGFN